MIRRVRTGDGAVLAAMFDRCSPQTRYRRFHGYATEIPATYLRRCLEGEHRAYVAEPSGAACAVGFGSVGPVDGASHVLEAGVLVEDAWQRRGIGRLLVARLFADAYALGAELIRLQMCREQASLLEYVVTRSHVVASSRSGCDVTVEVAVPSHAAGLTRRRRPAAGTVR